MTRRFFVSMYAAGVLFAQPALRLEINAEVRRQTVTELAKLMRARYAVAEGAEAAARLIERKLSEGAYDGFREAEAFANAINSDIRNATRDKHLQFGVAPPPETSPASANADAAPSTRLRWNNFSLPKVAILPGNIGYLEVLRFQPPDLAGDTLAAALAFVANADAIIVDVRNCRGGSPFLMPIFAGYFFSRPTHLFDMEFRGDQYTDHYWTAAWLPGKRLPEVPMYILTSAYTFSGAEGFAYRFQVLKRAKIVGETTGGGANAGGVRDVPPFFRVWMPMGRPVDRDTGKNWEGTGVTPDIKTAASDALESAHIHALQALRAKGDASRLDRALEAAKASYHPVHLTPEDLDHLAGDYGRCRVWVEGNQLRIRQGTGAPYLLAPLTRTVFASGTNDPVRAEFFPGADGRGHKVTFTGEDGRVEGCAAKR